MNDREQELYRREMDALSPCDEAMAKLKAAALDAAESAARPEKKSSSPLTPRRLRICAASAFAAAALLLTFCLPSLRVFFSRTDDGESPIQFTSYSELYRSVSALCEPIYRGSADGIPDSAPLSLTHRDTNNQVEGVEEGNLVKTDGQYIYSLSVQLDWNNNVKTRLCISRTSEDGTLSPVSDTDLEDLLGIENASGVSDLFLTEDGCLVLLRSNTRVYGESGSLKTDRDVCNEEGLRTYLEVLDVSNPAFPRLIESFCQAGYAESGDCRMVGSDFYLITHQVLDATKMEKEHPESFVPVCGRGEATAPIAVKDIYYSANASISSDRLTYVVLGGFTLSRTPAYNTQTAVFGYADDIYVTPESLYLTQNDAEIRSLISHACVYRFSLENGRISFGAQGFVPGNALNQFSMQEKDGVFCMVTNYYDHADGNRYTGLFTFDTALSPLGKLDGLARGESIYSVRFDGDLVYFVTYREVDPLFCVDISDPKRPKLLSELKVPGYSAYLHRWDENTLLGLGQEEEGVLKVSVFDTAQDGSTAERQVIRFDNTSFSDLPYTARIDTPTQKEHRALLVSPEKNLFAFLICTDTSGDEDFLVFLREDEDGRFFETILPFRFSADAPMSHPVDDAAEHVRVLYVGNVLYISSDSALLSFDPATLEQLDVIRF